MSAHPDLDADLAAALAVLERLFGLNPQPPRVLAVHPNPPRPHPSARPWPAPEAEQPRLPGLDPEGRRT